MFYNGAICDIYIGKGAGKKLLNDIDNAKKSIKIVSPYLSPFLITELIKLRNRNLNVELITTDNIEDFYGAYDKNILKLINQNRETDEIAVGLRNRWKKTAKIFISIGFGFTAVWIGLLYYFQNNKLLLGLIPIIALFVVVKMFRNKIKNKRIYSYWYSQLFPFKVYLSPDKSNRSDTFIHSKIYLIDDQIAYLGSLNFTSSGTKHNYETRIRTEDSSAIKAIKNEIHQLLNNSPLPERDIQSWGRKLYKEPIN